MDTNGKLGILDNYGRPWRQSDERPDPHASLAHVHTFAALLRGSAQTYFREQWDEALRHQRDNALAMRLDPHLQACLRERIRGTTSLKWHLEPDDAKDAHQQAVADGMTKIVQTIPYLQQFRRYMMQKLWYGRYGGQIEWAWRDMMLPGVDVGPDFLGGGKQTSKPIKALCVRRHIPLNGDKIEWTWDNHPMTRINAAYAQQYGEIGEVITDNKGHSLVLKGGWRERFVIQKYDIDDADFEDPTKAAAISGVGIRNWLYWSWWNRMEAATSITDALERYGLGIIVVYYDPANATAAAEALTLAQTYSRRAVVTIPRSGVGHHSGGVEVVNAPLQGVEVLRILEKAFEDREERFIIAQTMSSDHTGSGGLGGSGAADFQMQTKWQLIAEDAMEEAEGLTGSDLEPGLLSVIFRWTYPWAVGKFPCPKWVNNIPDVDPAKKLATVSAGFALGVDFRKDDVRKVTGMEKPGPDDEICSQAQMMQEQQKMQADAQQAMQPNPGEQPPGGPPGGAVTTPGGPESPEDPEFAKLFDQAKPEEPKPASEYGRDEPERYNVVDHTGHAHDDLGLFTSKFAHKSMLSAPEDLEEAIKLDPWQYINKEFMTPEEHRKADRAFEAIHKAKQALTSEAAQKIYEKLGKGHYGPKPKMGTIKKASGNLPKLHVVKGNAFANKDKIKAAGGHWASEMKKWVVDDAGKEKLKGISGLSIEELENVPEDVQQHFRGGRKEAKDFEREEEAVHYDDLEPHSEGGNVAEPSAPAPKLPTVKAPPFHSRLQKSLEGLGNPIKPIPVSGVMNRIKKAGVANEELEHTRMAEALQGKQHVTPEELLKHFHQNKVEVGEVHKGSEPGMQPTGSSKMPNSHDYQTPGGSNYRELLLTVPVSKSLPPGHSFKVQDGKTYIADDKGYLVSSPYANEEEALHGWQTKNKTAQGVYHGSHWDEPNVLAHVRYNTRQGPNGEKVLHVEEVQSDWHQTGREQGYKTGKEGPSPLAAFEKEMEAKHGREAVETGAGLTPEEKDRHEELQLQDIKRQRAVPDAPFKTSWPELAMKRMLYHAAEHGYDRVTLNPGEQINKVLGGPHEESLQGQAAFYGTNLSAQELGGIAYRNAEKTPEKDRTKQQQALLSGMMTPDQAGEQIRQVRTLPNILGKLGKQFGAKVEPHELNIPDEDENRVFTNGKQWPMKGKDLPVTSLRLTPEMREKILTTGFPHMEEGGVAEGGETVLQPGEVVEPAKAEPWQVPNLPGSDPNKDSVVADLGKGDVVVPKKSTSLFPLVKKVNDG